MDDGSKFDRGIEHIRNAEKFLKTGLLKWKPDYDSAAAEYVKAGVCFKSAKANGQCRDAYIKAANCYKENKSLFQSAKCLEQVILIMKELGEYQDIAKYAEDASNMYQVHGSADTSALLLDKTASMIQEYSTVDALRLFQHAADVAMMQDSVKQAAEYTNKATRILIRLKHFDEAVSAVRREISLQLQSESTATIGRLAVGLVLLHLARKDYVAAEKAFKEWGNYCEAPEVQMLETLLDAYDEEDAENVTKALNNPFIKHMDIEYSRLAKDLPLPNSTASIPPPASIRHNAAPSYVSPKESAPPEGFADKLESSQETKDAIQSPDDDDEGLC